MAFIAWFIAKGLEFQKSVVWKPLANVKTLGREEGELNSEDKNLMFYSRLEVVEVFETRKIPKKELTKFLISKKMQSESSSAVISHKELLDGLATHSASNSNTELNEVSFSNSTFLEGLNAMLFTPRREAGKYYPVQEGGDVNYPWGYRFNK
jgi:hypothetical protein